MAAHVVLEQVTSLTHVGTAAAAAAAAATSMTSDRQYAF